MYYSNSNLRKIFSFQFSSVTQSCPTVCDPMTAACQASLSIISSRSLLKLMSIELVMPSSHLILCRPLLLLPSIFPIRVFSNESVLHIMWPTYWSFCFSISPSNEYSGLVSFRMVLLDLLAVQGTLKCLMNYGWRFVTLYKRRGSRSSPTKRNGKRQNGFLRRPYK